MPQEIPIGLVYDAPGAKPIDKDHVARLALAMARDGQTHAITVREVTRHKGTTPFTAYEIINGHRRYKAACNLKWEFVRCEVVSFDEVRVELARLDESLMRVELSPAQAAAAVMRRQELYELLHPQPQGVNTDLVAFVTDTVAATKLGATAIYSRVRQGKALKDDLQRLVGTSLDRTRELEALCRVSAEARAELIRRAVAGETVSASAALSSKAPAQPHEPEPVAGNVLETLKAAWDTASRDERQQFIEYLSNPAAGDASVALNARLRRRAKRYALQPEARL